MPSVRHHKWKLITVITNSLNCRKPNSKSCITHTHVCTHMHADTHACMHACTHTQTETYVYAHRNIHMHTRCIHACTQQSNLNNSQKNVEGIESLLVVVAFKQLFVLYLLTRILPFWFFPLHFSPMPLRHED